MSGRCPSQPLRVVSRVLSTGRPVAYVPGFRARYVGDLDWEDRALSRLPARIRQMRHWIALLARYGFDVRTGRLLEVGTGPGLDTRLLAALTEMPLHSIDIQQRFASGAPEYPAYRRLHTCLDGRVEDHLRVPPFSETRRYRLLQMDARALTFPDEAFDLVFCKSTLKLIPSPAQALRECLRVLRPGGLLFIVDEPFPSLFGLCRGGVTDVPWAHVYLTAAEFQEALPTDPTARARILTNWRAATRLTREAIVQGTRPGAVLLSERTEYAGLPAAFLAEVFRIVPELEALGRETLEALEVELLFRRADPEP